VSQNVTNWAWNYTPGKGTVKIGTNGTVIPVVPIITPSIETPVRVSPIYGFFSPPIKVGDGIPALVGTVTITADTPGSFMGGGFQYPGGDGFLDGSFVDDPPTVNLGTFTVTP
jgi:hypothetical protein